MYKSLKDEPIQLKLRKVVLLTCGAMLVLTCTAYFTYELINFRQTAKVQLSMVGEIIAANSTAALAFDNNDDAKEILTALKADKNIVAACLYDKKGKIFSIYPAGFLSNDFPAGPQKTGYNFVGSRLEGFQPVIQGDDLMGTLYLKYDMSAMYGRLGLYGVIALLIATFSFILAYFLSKRLQKTIALPILGLAATARVISEGKDYSVRATKYGNDEMGVLTDAFNHMLNQIETQNAEIVSFNQKLEEKISERTQQLEFANSELEKSNNDLEQFASVASHDLQEPLRKIQTFSDLAERSLNNEEAAKLYISKINSSAQRMARLISAVLNYSRLSHTDHQFEAVNLNEILENVKSDLELIMQEKSAVLKSDELPIVYGVPLQFNQLFLNLISNSLKFCSDKPVINISFRKCPKQETSMLEGLDPQDSFGELVFTDNGIGFEQHHADKVFNIFQRLHSTKKYAGTGIGLALCKKIVNRHRGIITVKSEPGKGTSFYIYLPLYTPQAVPESKVAVPPRI